MKRTAFPTLLTAAVVLCGGTQPTGATVSFTLAGYTNDFSVNTVTGDWITSTSNIPGAAGDTTFQTAAEIDTFVIDNNYNAAGLTTALGTSATNPPSANALARRNTTLNVLQMRPLSTAIKAANVLVLRMQNDTGALVPKLDVTYDFAEAVAGTEEVPGWQAYYSFTGNSNWVKIPEFSGGATGTLTANLNFSPGWAPGSLIYFMWVDDNAAAVDEAAYTMDNLSITVPITPLITATLASATRLTGASATDPSDDTLTVSVTVDGTNLPPGTPGWTTTSGLPTNITGTYGQTVNVPGIPVTSLPLTIGLADRLNPAVVSEFILTSTQLPHYAALNLLGTPGYVTLETTSAPQWVANGGSLVIQQANGGGTVPFEATTEPVTFAAGTAKSVRLNLEVQDTSAGSNFETEDTLKIELVTDAGTFNLIRHLDVNGDGLMNGYSGTTEVPYDSVPLADEFNRGGLLITDAFTNVWHLHGVIPAAATTAHLLLSGVNNSTTEFYRVRDVVFAPLVDTDGDGFANSVEIQADTDPASAASFLKVVSRELTGGVFSATVLSSANRTYQLETSDDLSTWKVTGAAQVGTNAELTLSTPVTELQKFVRVAAQ